MQPQYDHPTAFSLWGEEERAAIARVMKSGRFTMGDECAAFEEEFAAAHGRKYGIMVNSGSSANLVAVSALFNKGERPLTGPRGPHYEWDKYGRGRSAGPAETAGDHAVVPAVAWSTTYAPLVQHGLGLELVDVDATWNAPPKIIGNASLIVLCSILGNPCYGREWVGAVKDVGAYVLEDNCESFWALGHDQRRCGTYGDLSTFSFFHSHQISAIEGGMILTDDEELANLCRILRAHGWTRDVWWNAAHSGRVLPPFEKEYDFTHFGYNVRPLELHAAIAREQLKKADDFMHARRANAAAFRELAARVYQLPVEVPPWNGKPNPFGLHFLCESPEARRQVVTALRANGIDCRLPTGGSFRLHPYGARWREQPTPVADDVHDRGLFLGNAPFDITDKIERAVGIMKDVLGRKAA